jgi:lipoate-protein ligase B
MTGISSNCIEWKRHSEKAPWSYADLDRRQREIASEVRSGRPGSLLLSEVAPVITCGRRTSPQDLLFPPEVLAQQGIQLYTTDRGGLATYHGPGQWILFPVHSLQTLTGDSRGVRKAVDCLLEIALRVGRSYDSSAHIRTGAELGVWTDRGKFAAVGIHVDQRILLHGLSINGFRTSQSFQGLRPCGLDAPLEFLLKNPSETEFVRLGQQILSTASNIFFTRIDGGSK